MTVMMESGCFLPALAKYKQALAILEDGLLASTKSEQREINVNRAKCLMNLAASSMAIQNYGDAVRDLNEANMLLPNDKKILLRRARANTHQGNFDEAIADIIRVKQFSRTFDIDLMIANIQTAKRKARIKEMNIAQRAIGLRP